MSCLAPRFLCIFFRNYFREITKILQEFLKIFFLRVFQNPIWSEMLCRFFFYFTGIPLRIWKFLKGFFLKFYWEFFSRNCLRNSFQNHQLFLRKYHTSFKISCFTNLFRDSLGNLSKDPYKKKSVYIRIKMLSEILRGVFRKTS